MSEVVHRCPPGDEALTPCCRFSPLELPFDDRLTTDPELVTCQGRVKRELTSSEKASLAVDAAELLTHRINASIVRKLAESDPYVVDDGSCFHCGGLNLGISTDVSHRPGCLWLEANKAVGE
jgi:hypothetical protein